MANLSPTIIPPLTSIRGIAALAVVLFHINLTFPTSGLLLFNYFRGGELGVDLFFVLSGFILAHVYTNEYIPGNNVRFTVDFIQARLARIYPLHLVSLIATLALVALLPGFSERYRNYFSIESFILNIFLIHNWGLIGISWNAVSWSISAEWFMYLLFPFILAAYRAWVLALKSRPATLCVLVIITLTIHYSIILSKSWGNYGGTSAGGMVRVFFEFLLGFLTYQFRSLFRPRCKTCFDVFTFLLICAACIAFFISEFWMFFVPIIALLILTLSYNLGYFAKILSLTPFVYLGNISFSLYMWHWLIIQVHNIARANGYWSIANRNQLYIHTFSMVLLSVTATGLSYQLIERPGRRLLKSSAYLRGHSPSRQIKD